MEWLTNFINSLQDILVGLGILGVVLACFLMFCDSIVPFMPISVMLTILFYVYGNFWGLVIGYVFTCLGCFVSYELCSRYLTKFIEKVIMPKLGEKKRTVLERLIHKISRFSTSTLTIALAIPFTPCSPMNVAAGVTKIDRKKFYVSVIASKWVMVYFWGYIGTSLLESIHNPWILLKVAIVIAGAWGISKLLSKVLKFD